MSEIGAERRRVRVKICGVTDPADAEAAIALGADALGFNGWRGSKRYLDLRAAAGWIRDLGPMVSRVAVLVNPSAQELEDLIALEVFDAIQLHGDEQPDFWECYADQGVRIWRAIRLTSPADAESDAERMLRKVQCVVLDAAVPGEYGGTGHVADWTAGRAFVANHSVPVLLSGGLTPANVGEGIRAVRPFGVDVASGVEDRPGKKSHSKLAAFMDAVLANGLF
jgi:phosphoribosylanthranilate isomerase